LVQAKRFFACAFSFDELMVATGNVKWLVAEQTRDVRAFTYGLACYCDLTLRRNVRSRV